MRNEIVLREHFDKLSVKPQTLFISNYSYKTPRLKKGEDRFSSFAVNQEWLKILVLNSIFFTRSRLISSKVLILSDQSSLSLTLPTFPLPRKGILKTSFVSIEVFEMRKLLMVLTKDLSRFIIAAFK